MKKFFTPAATLLIASTSVAWGGATTAVNVDSLSYLISTQGAVVVVNIPLQSVTGAPACAITQDTEYHFALNLQAPGGNALLAGLIAAQSAGTTVVFFGTGTCSIGNGWETIGSTRIPN